MSDDKQVTHEVTEAEWQLLQAYKISQEVLSSTQAVQFRDNQLRHLKTKLVQLQREIDFKQAEVEGVVIEKHPDFENSIKPKWFVENDIDELKMAQEDIRVQIRNIESAEEEAKK